MANKFLSFLSHVGGFFKQALSVVIPVATAAEPIVGLLIPGVGPIFHSTVSSVIAIEQKYAAAGQQNGTGPQKLADVVSIIGPLVELGLGVAGQPEAKTVVENYVNAVVALLNAIPATAIGYLPAPKVS